MWWNVSLATSSFSAGELQEDGRISRRHEVNCPPPSRERAPLKIGRGKWANKVSLILPRLMWKIRNWHSRCRWGAARCQPAIYGASRRLVLRGIFSFFFPFFNELTSTKRVWMKCSDGDNSGVEEAACGAHLSPRLGHPPMGVPVPWWGSFPSLLTAAPWHCMSRDCNTYLFLVEKNNNQTDNFYFSLMRS